MFGLLSLVEYILTHYLFSTLTVFLGLPLIVWYMFVLPLQYGATGPDRRKLREPAFNCHEHPPNPLLTPIDGLSCGEVIDKLGWVAETGFYELQSKDCRLWYQVLRPRNFREIRFRSVMLLVHGYGDHCDFGLFNDARNLVEREKACVVLFDQPGFGRSDGLWCFIPHWFTHVAAIYEFTENFVLPLKKDMEMHSGKTLEFIGYGASMGGAVVLTLSMLHKALFDGIILIAPMCRVQDNMKPSKIVEYSLRWVAYLFPSVPILPTEDLLEHCYVQKSAAEYSLQHNTVSYFGKPRLGTALSILEAQNFIMANMELLSTPLLVLHGESDKVTDPLCSQELFKRASSLQKSIRIYEKMKHVLTGGMPREDLERVFSDISNFLDEVTNQVPSLQRTEGGLLVPVEMRTKNEDPISSSHPLSGLPSRSTAPSLQFVGSAERSSEDGKQREITLGFDAEGESGGTGSKLLTENIRRRNLVKEQGLDRVSESAFATVKSM